MINDERSDPGNAEPQLGTASPNPKLTRGWFSRGYLPHADYPRLLQVITYRLCDSLAASVLERLEHELRHTPASQLEVEKRRTIEQWPDAGHGSCILRQPEAANCVVNTWHKFDGERYDLIAWVVMPNHVHVLIRVYEGVSLGKIIQSWKSYTGRRIGELARKLQIAFESNTDHGVWMREYWDRYIRDENHYHAAIHYIHNNPVKAGLVKNQIDWPWSSAKKYQCGAELGLGVPGGRRD